MSLHSNNNSSHLSKALQSLLCFSVGATSCGYTSRAHSEEPTPKSAQQGFDTSSLPQSPFAPSFTPEELSFDRGIRIPRFDFDSQPYLYALSFRFHDDSKWYHALILEAGLKAAEQNPEWKAEEILEVMNRSAVELDRLHSQAMASDRVYNPSPEVNAGAEVLGKMFSGLEIWVKTSKKSDKRALFTDIAVVLAKWLNVRVADVTEHFRGDMARAEIRTDAQRKLAQQRQHYRGKRQEEILMDVAKNAPKMIPAMKQVVSTFSLQHGAVSPFDTPEQILESSVQFRIHVATLQGIKSSLEQQRLILAELTSLRKAYDTLAQQNGMPRFSEEVPLTEEQVAQLVGPVKEELNRVSGEILKRINLLDDDLKKGFTNFQKDFNTKLRQEHQETRTTLVKFIAGVESEKQKAEEEASVARLSRENTDRGLMLSGQFGKFLFRNDPQTVRAIGIAQQTAASYIAMNRSLDRYTQVVRGGSEDAISAASGALALDISSVALSVLQLCIDTGPSADEIILNEINALREDIYELRTELNQVGRQVSALHSDMQISFQYVFEAFDIVFETLGNLDAKFDDIALVAGEIRQSQSQLKETLEGHAAQIQQMLRAGFREDEIRAYNRLVKILIDTIEFSPKEWLLYTRDIITNAEQIARNNVSIGKLPQTRPELSDAGAYERSGTSGYLDEDYIGRYLSDKGMLALTYPVGTRLPQVSEWVGWADLYCRYVNVGADYAKQSTLDELIRLKETCDQIIEQREGGFASTPKAQERSLSVVDKMLMRYEEAAIRLQKSYLQVENVIRARSVPQGRTRYKIPELIRVKKGKSSLHALLSFARFVPEEAHLIDEYLRMNNKNGLQIQWSLDLHLIPETKKESHGYHCNNFYMADRHTYSIGITLEGYVEKYGQIVSVSADTKQSVTYSFNLRENPEVVKQLREIDAKNNVTIPSLEVERRKYREDYEKLQPFFLDVAPNISEITDDSLKRSLYYGIGALRWTLQGLKHKGGKTIPSVDEEIVWTAPDKTLEGLKRMKAEWQRIQLRGENYTRQATRSLLVSFAQDNAYVPEALSLDDYRRFKNDYESFHGTRLVLMRLLEIYYPDLLKKTASSESELDTNEPALPEKSLFPTEVEFADIDAFSRIFEGTTASEGSSFLSPESRVGMSLQRVKDFVSSAEKDATEKNALATLKSLKESIENSIRIVTQRLANKKNSSESSP